MNNTFQPSDDLYQIKPWLALTALLLDWGIIIVSFSVVTLYPLWFVYLSAAIIIARTQLALAVIMHESAHGILLPQQKWNDIIGQVLSAAPLFLSMKTYRAGHIKHHQNPMVADDPVAVVFQVNDYPISRNTLFLRLLMDLSGIGVCINIWKTLRGSYQQVLPPIHKSRASQAWEIGSIVFVHGTMLGILAAHGNALLYVQLWILPALTLLPFMGRVRAIMEHAGMPPTENQALNARTITRPSWQTFLFGPHAIHYHIEHHLYVRIPFYHLGIVHQQMTEQQLLPLSNVYLDYVNILKDVSYPTRSKPL